MNNFAVIENNLVVNVVVSDINHAESQGWVPLDEFAGIGWSYEDGKFIDKRPKFSVEKTAKLQREQRDFLLERTDWCMASDVPQETKDRWLPYRQALRDVPQQTGFPENIIWPVSPAETTLIASVI